MAANFCLHLSDSKFLEIICLDIVSVQRHDFPVLALAPYGRCSSPLAEVLLLPFSASLSMVLLRLSAASQMFPLFEF